MEEVPRIFETIPRQNAESNSKIDKNNNVNGINSLLDKNNNNSIDEDLVEILEKISNLETTS